MIVLLSTLNSSLTHVRHSRCWPTANETFQEMKKEGKSLPRTTCKIDESARDLNREVEYTRAMKRAMGVPENELENTQRTMKSNRSQTENKESTQEQCEEQTAIPKTELENAERTLKSNGSQTFRFIYQSNDNLNERSTRKPRILKKSVP